MPDFKECFKTHPMLHSLTGLGVGLLIAGVIPSLGGQTGVVLGIILAAGGIVGEFVVSGKK